MDGGFPVDGREDTAGMGRRADLRRSRDRLVGVGGVLAEVSLIDLLPGEDCQIVASFHG